MLRRRAAALATGAAATLVLGLVSGSPATAGTAPDVPAGMMQAMQRDLGLTPAQAEARLANEAEATTTEKTLKRQLAGSFAGAWTTGATSQLVVATTDAAEADAISRAGAKAKVVDHSSAALDRAKKALDKEAKGGSDAPALWYVDAQSNSVVVKSSSASAAAKFVKAAGADSDAVRVVKSDVAPRALANIRGGDAYYMGSGGRCSVGFAVTGGFVTAGHCGTTGTTTRGYDQTAQGTFRGSSFPGNDYAWVATNSSWTPTPTVAGSPQRVAGSTTATAGSSVCRSGSTTGWHCGTIRQLNTSVTYAEGTIYGVTRTTVCAEPGDSGGSYISGSQAQGVTSGGSGNCRTGGETYFQPVNEILQTYGLRLTTG